MAEMSGRIIEAQDSDASQELEGQSSAAPTVNRRYVLPSGRIMPNTIFVGGIDFEMGEDEMRGFFTRYGAVKQVKIISDGGGVSRGYGFVSFHNDVDIQKIISESQISFKGKKLKIGPAIRKQQDSYPIHLVQARPAPLITSPTPCVCQNADTYFQSPGFPGSALQYVQTYSYPSPPAVALPQVQMGYPHPAYNYQAATQWPPGGQWRWMMPQVMPTAGTYVNTPYPEMINPGTVFVQRECDAQQTPSSPLDTVEKSSDAKLHPIDAEEKPQSRSLTLLKTTVKRNLRPPPKLPKGILGWSFESWAQIHLVFNVVTKAA
ncbi:deleted in azoospermia-like isoform X3 [Chiloscyllium plagiosum]|uniref:deleted in azoospermia-like isoform X3 n=1 Tax=Chiloscyllium plagiosum TaxID=36176 RepID=UPI001CB814AB|nr:deleted in azoospermia-like isoform X3 [Chiloscyllium plagiosum]